VSDFHPREVVLTGPLVVRKGIREGQGLIIGDRPLSLGDLAQKGERVEISVGELPLGKYLLRMER
jgi:hypothetical protein